MPKRKPCPDQLPIDLRVKWCPRCEQELPGWEFAQAKNLKDGLTGYCKPCYKVYWSEYYGTAKRVKASQRKKARYKREREQILEYKRAWRKANIETARAQARRRRQANLETNRAAVRAWHKSHPEAKLAAKNRRRARKTGARTIQFTLRQLAQRWSYYGDRCWICSAAATETDHVKPLSKGGAHMLCNLRPICKPCNSAKRDKWPFAKDMVRLG